MRARVKARARAMPGVVGELAAVDAALQGVCEHEARDSGGVEPRRARAGALARLRVERDDGGPHQDVASSEREVAAGGATRSSWKAIRKLPASSSTTMRSIRRCRGPQHSRCRQRPASCRQRSTAQLQSDPERKRHQGRAFSAAPGCPAFPGLGRLVAAAAPPPLEAIHARRR